jgi:subtilisin family serine protease
MRAGDHVTRTSVFAQLLLVGCWLSVCQPPGRAGLVSGAAAGAATAKSSTGLPATAGQAAQTGPTLATATYDAGEFLRIGTRQIPLLRSRQKVAVIQAPSAGIQAASQPGEIETKDRLYRFERYIRPSGASGPAGNSAVTVFQTRKFASVDEQTQSMHGLEQQTAAEEVVPVYLHGDSGLEMIPTGKIVVKLKIKDDLAGLAAINRRLGTSIDRRIRGTADQYILAASHSTARQLFDLCAALEKESALEWAEPDFISQVVRHSYKPNDPFFDPDQWYLKDINVPQAWDIVTGSDQIIIAFLDNGMDLQHEDLKGALPSNAGEVAGNGVDDDHNGWTDDLNGWNFHDDNNNPNPASPYDNHGTQVAGVAAATGNNGKGIAGCAFGCKLMPLKVLEGDPREEKEDVINSAIA